MTRLMTVALRLNGNATGTSCDGALSTDVDRASILSAKISVDTAGRVIIQSS